MLGYFLSLILIVVGVNILLRNIATHEFKFTFRIKKLQFIINSGTLAQSYRHIVASAIISKRTGYLGLYLWTLFFELSWLE